MSGNLHPKTKHPSDTDLKSNPGIGASPGMIKGVDDIEEEDGDNTFEGDIENDAGLGGGVDPNQRGRTNK